MATYTKSNADGYGELLCRGRYEVIKVTTLPIFLGIEIHPVNCISDATYSCTKEEFEAAYKMVLLQKKRRVKNGEIKVN